MKILITGANGQMGSEFRWLEESFEMYQFLFTDIEELDITNPDSVNAYFQSENPDIIINCAGYTAVDKAEEEPEKAMHINGIAPEILSKAATANDTLLIHISTDYVFNGQAYKPYTEEDSPDPISFYAQSKYAGEVAVETNANRGIIIRTSWLYSSYGNNFAKTILKLSNERENLNIIFDQIGTPTYARDLCKTILDILPDLETCQGVELFHYSNEGVASWYDFASAIVDLTRINCQVYPIETKEYPLPAPRPYYSVMNKRKIKSQFGIKIPHWRDSLKDCLALLNPLSEIEQ
ncbi:MAG: dTDP-4-dehydrorhamnose reductase [Bacteroidales bacterium]|nr:dTDP-4-dehydrorhamnose reductase [Bacteroidota bacterium]MBL6949337.1 dTDP-4-dehydrorhamnose reductase [Bacteroidales bacterium]